MQTFNILRFSLLLSHMNTFSSDCKTHFSHVFLFVLLFHNWLLNNKMADGQSNIFCSMMWWLMEKCCVLVNLPQASRGDLALTRSRFLEEAQQNQEDQALFFCRVWESPLEALRLGPFVAACFGKTRFVVEPCEALDEILCHTHELSSDSQLLTEP